MRTRLYAVHLHSPSISLIRSANHDLYPFLLLEALSPTLTLSHSLSRDLSLSLARSSHISQLGHLTSGAQLIRDSPALVALIILLLVIVYIVLAFVCHGPLLPSCLK